MFFFFTEWFLIQREFTTPETPKELGKKLPFGQLRAKIVMRSLARFGKSTTRYLHFGEKLLYITYVHKIKSSYIKL